MLSLLPLVLVALLVGFGYGELLPARVRKTLPLVEQVVFGLALLAGLATLCHLVVPLVGAVRLGLLAAGLTSAAVHRRTLLRRTRGRRAALAAACLLSLPAYLDVYHPDVDLHHAQAIRWLRDERLAFGLGQLSPPLARCSAWHTLAAVLGPDAAGALGYAALLPVPFALLGVRIFEAGRRLLARGAAASPSDLFLCASAYLLVGGVLRGVAAAPHDLAVAIVLVLATAALLERRRVAATCLAAFATAIHPTAAPFLLGCIVVLVAARARARPRPGGPPVPLAWALSLSLLILLPGVLVEAARARPAWSWLAVVGPSPPALGVRAALLRIADNLRGVGHARWTALLLAAMPFTIALGGLLRPHTTYAAVLVARRAVLPLVLASIGLYRVADPRSWLGGMLGLGFLLVTTAGLAWGLPLAGRRAKLTVLAAYAAFGIWCAPSALGRAAAPALEIVRPPAFRVPVPTRTENHGQLEVAVTAGPCGWSPPPCRQADAGDPGLTARRRGGWLFIEATGSRKVVR